MNKYESVVIINPKLEEESIKDLENVIKFESKVKHKTSQIFKEMDNILSQKKVEIIEFINNANSEKLDIVHRMLYEMIKASRN